MASMDGVVTIVQEGRFQLTDDAGVTHLFILGHAAAAEPEQLAAFAARTGAGAGALHAAAQPDRLTSRIALPART